MTGKLATITFLTAALLLRCGGKDTGQRDIEPGEPAREEKAVENLIPVDFKSIQGRWTLIYPEDYGYDFRFYPGYKALVILYLRTYSLVFSGVYNLEEKNRIKISISEMKKADTVAGINLHAGFTKVKSSHFEFNAGFQEKDSKTLILRPVNIIIDGNSSEGYFEPLLKLRKM